MYDPKNFEEIEEGLNEISDEVRENLRERNFAEDRIEIKVGYLENNGINGIIEDSQHEIQWNRHHHFYSRTPKWKV